jgi:PAS domain S-box-containing protein
VVSVPLAALLIVLAFSYVQHRRSERVEQALGRGLEVRTAVRQTLGALVDAETGVRGYLLTGDPAYLEPYERARRGFPQGWARLVESAEDTGASGLGDTETLARRRLEMLQSLVVSGPVGDGAAEGSLRRRLDNGKAVMDEVRARLRGIENEVQRDLDRRRAVAERLDRFGAAVIAAGVALGLGGGVLAMLLFVSGVARRVDRLQSKARTLEHAGSPTEWIHERDEIGRLGRTFEEASSLLAQRDRELRDSKAFLEDLIASSPGIIYRVSPTGAHPTYVSPNVKRILGFEATEVVRSPDDWLDHIDARDRESVAEKFGGSVAARAPTARTDVRVVRKDGITRMFSVLVSFDYDASGNVESVLAYALDVTEEKEAAQALRAREETLEAVVAASPDIIAMIDESGHMGDLGRAMYELLGYEEDRLSGPYERLAAVLHPDDREAVKAAISAAVGGHSDEVNIRMRARHAAGHWVVLEARGRAVSEHGDHLSGVVLVTRDVSAQATLEDALKTAKDEAERANNEKSEFLSRMSHELRTPLNSILGFGQLLELEDLNPEQYESVKQVMRSGRHLLELIDEVLDISRIESGTISMSTEPVVVEDVIAESLDMVRPLATSKNVTVYSDLEMSDPVHVLADRHRLKQVLLNLLSNAIKYNSEKGSVIVSCQTRDHNKIRISVRDTGRGIAKDKMARLFTPFDRLGAEETGVAGTGLGLALSRRLVEVMGGALGAESVVGDGSTFWLDLLVTSDPVAAHLDLEEVRQAQPGVDCQVVLYIEDNLSNMRLVERLLAHRTPVQLVPAMKGRLGLEFAREHRPDLILLDVHLPDMTGEEVLEQLQADSVTKSIPVVVISADATSAQRRRLLDVGALHYLTKPLDLEQFLDVVVTILAEKVS